ncbi:MAG TPA: hypothetical protein VFA40_10500 [Terriglobales bacterium]|jgi:hypothetical protein|nr:hypothetical protein [Terriglobales bacterium]
MGAIRPSVPEDSGLAIHDTGAESKVKQNWRERSQPRTVAEWRQTEAEMGRLNVETKNPVATEELL